MPNDNGDANRFGPDISVSIPEGATGVSLWAKVNSADANGVTIDNVKEGDVIKIDFIGGSASFSDRSGWDHIKSIIGIVGSMPEAILGSLGSQIGKAAKKAADNANLKAFTGKGLVRNGYGRKKSGKFALKEGGIVVCMPSAQGTIHARKGTYPLQAAENRGRLATHVPAGIQDKCFFPVRGREMQMTASKAGVICILAFDSEFEDNEGAYEVKFTITRPSEMKPGEQDRVEEELLSCFCEAGL